ncbi:MAG: benzoyl-CoA-dihydrodiol lyase [Candidatus Latescibacterota bacterium]|nr:MAG: benzoyl-CoA-dihydrodiol lyase [Candidatus Latescibacterota bacterium]
MHPIHFETHPDRYRHWTLSVDGAIARLRLDVQEDAPLHPGYVLKLNSYDLGVDIELADAVQRLRFEHPEVGAVIIQSDKDRVFSAGANIHMLGMSTHAFKVNFCKYTNETRLAIEDASRNSGLHFIAACNGVTAGGGYELALACDEIILIDDGSSAVSLPEVPLLGVLPGTGGLTRVVDKRQVRRDRADIFCTLSEGIRGKRAMEWGLVDALVPRSRFDAEVESRARARVESSTRPQAPGVLLPPLEPERGNDGTRYRHVTLALDREHRQARITVHAPKEAPPAAAAGVREQGADAWPLRVFRELDAVLCDLRFNEAQCGLILLETRGDAEHVLAWDRLLHAERHDWFVREIVLHAARTLRRLDLTARSLFALVQPDSCFAGTLLELALAADRTYALDDPERPVEMATSPLNAGALPMTHGLTRLQARWLHAPERVQEVLEGGPYRPEEAEAAALVTVVADDIDWEDEVRVAIEERCSLSPDALTGMEASLRYPGAENMSSKVFGRLSAWQNWVFQRPNAVGERGALKLYGRPERPSFDWGRT